MEESIILELDFKADDYIKTTARARGEMAALKEEQKQLKKAGQEGSEQFTQNAVRLKTLSKEVSTNERLLQANLKAQQANKGSLQQLKAQLSLATQQYNELSEEERENSEEGKRLQKVTKDLTDKLIEQEAAVGNNRRAVGNYKEAVTEALEESGLFAKQMGFLKDAQQAYNVVAKLSTASTKSFKAALISTGIGAIVVALGSLVLLLTKTQKGMDLVKQVTAGLGAVLDVVIDRALSFGNGIVKLFKGDMAGAIEDFKSSFKGVGEEIVDEYKAAARITDELQKIEKAEKRLEVQRAKSRAEIAKLKFEAEDATKSESERFEAAAKALGIERDQLSQAIALQEKRIALLKEQNDLGTSTEEDLQRVRDAEIELANLQAESTEKQIELNNKKNALDKSINDKIAARKAKAEKDELERLEKEKKRLEKLAAEEEKRQKEADKAFEDSIKERSRQFEMSLQRDLIALKERYASGELTEEEFSKRLTEINRKGLELRRDLAKQIEQDILNDKTISEEERIKLQKEVEERILESEEAILDAKITANEKAIEDEKQKNQERIDSQIQTAQEIGNTLNSLNQLSNSLSNSRISKLEEQRDKEIALAKGNKSKQEQIERDFQKKIAQQQIEQAKRDRQIATFNAIINTAATIMKTMATMGYPAGLAFSVLAGIQGAAQVAAIQSEPLPKAERGETFLIGGKPHSAGGTKFYGEDGTQFEAEKGELLTVINKRSVGMLGQLSKLNQLGGGKAFGSPKGFLADGGLVARSAGNQPLQRMDSQRFGRDVVDSVSKIQVITRISDIEDIQSSRDSILARATL